jgi:hypothetical protein
MKPLIKLECIFLLLTWITSTSVSAQKNIGNAEVDITQDGRGWVFGLNVGVYYPSKQTSAYYNGNPSNVNNVNYVMSNYYWYQDIFHALGAHDSISVSGLPQNMHYKLAMQPGLYAQYCFNSRLALMIEFNYMRLKANDVISFEVDPKPYATNPDLRFYPMRGVEDRVYGDIGLKLTTPKTDKLSLFFTAGLNVNSTKVIKSSFYVEDVEYSMINTYGNNSYIPNSNMQTYAIYQGGIGFGVFGGGGVALTFGNGIVIEPGITAHWLMVKLEGYNEMNPGIGAYVRFLF